MSASRGQQALFDLDGEVACGARLSECERYRYSLWRVWDVSLPPAVFVGCNPSTADAKEDDPTIRRCVAFARRWGRGGMYMVNLFPYRATDPRELHGVVDAPGLLGERNVDDGLVNDDWIQWAVEGAGVVVAAWGAIKLPPQHERRREEVRVLLGDGAVALRLTKDGHPSHPLYVPGDVEPVAYAGVGA
jgi:hypothetical protein